MLEHPSAIAAYGPSWKVCSALQQHDKYILRVIPVIGDEKYDRPTPCFFDCKMKRVPSRVGLFFRSSNQGDVRSPREEECRGDCKGRCENGNRCATSV